MRNRIFTVLLAVVMVLAVLPTAVFATDTATVYIAGTAYTTDDTDESDGVTIDFTNRTITLSNAVLSRTTSQDSDCLTISEEEGILLTSALFINDTNAWTIKLIGNSKITITNSYKPSAWNNYLAIAGIVSFGDLTITSDSNGDLTVAVNENMANMLVYGIWATLESDLIIENCSVESNMVYSDNTASIGEAISASTGSLKINNAIVKATSTGLYDKAISAYNNIDISGQNTSVTVDVADTQNSSGIASNKLTISEGTLEIDASIGINCSEVSITNSSNVDIDSTKTGIFTSTALEISSDNVNVTATEETGKAIEFGHDGTVVISSGTFVGDIVSQAPNNNSESSVTIKGTASITGNVSVGDNDNLTIENGTITGNVSSGKASEITMSGGTVSGSLSTGTDENSSLTVTGGAVDGVVITNSTNASITGGTFKDESIDQYLDDDINRDDNGNIGATVTVTFNPNNGDTVFTRTVFVSNNIPEPTAPVRTGYNFLGWSADGVTTVQFPYTVTTDTTLTALWEEVKQDNNDFWMAMLMYMMMNQKFDVTATVTEGGTISDAGLSQIQRGKDVTYTITPDEGYAIADVLVDGESVGAVSVYTFDNVKKAHTIEAVFVKTAWVNPYSDVTENDWFYEDVAYVTENGIMNGVIENDTFAPDATATRAMLVTILWRLEGEPITDSAVDFFDVPADEWYSEAVKWASANGIVQGYEGLFNPGNALTREQVAAIIHRYAAYKGMDNGIALPMVAQYDCSVWAENDVNWADANGLFDGIGSDMRDMTADATRAEVAAMLRRMCEYFE